VVYWRVHQGRVSRGDPHRGGVKCKAKGHPVGKNPLENLLNHVLSG
jgi:hypothetical protein